MSYPAKPDDEFNIFEAFGQATLLYADNLRLFLVPALAAAVLPIVMLVLDNTEIASFQDFWFVLWPFSFCIQVFVVLFLILAVSRRTINEEVSLRTTLEDVFLLFWKGAGSILLFGAILGAGLLLFIIPFFYWFTLLFFFSFFIALENKDVWAAFKDSEHLVAGRFWMVFQTHAFVAGIIIAIYLPLMIGLGLMGIEGVYRSILYRLLGAFMAPFFVAVYYLLFKWLKTKTTAAGAISVYKTS